MSRFLMINGQRYSNKGKRCSVDGCNKSARAKGFCGMHWERVKAHGNVNADFRRGSKVPKVTCSIEGCTNMAVSYRSGICMVHYGRKHRHGDFKSRLPTYGEYKHIHEQGYVMLRQSNGKYKMEHVILAEKALGKPLPPKAVVHHMNGDEADNHTPFNLIICQDQAYHFLLHRRQRAADFARSMGWNVQKFLETVK